MARELPHDQHNDAADDQPGDRRPDRVRDPLDRPGREADHLAERMRKVVDGMGQRFEDVQLLEPVEQDCRLPTASPQCRCPTGR